MDSDKICDDSTIKNTPNTSQLNVCFKKTGTKHNSNTLLRFVPVFLKQTLLGQSAQIGSNIWDIIGKSPH